MGLGSEAMLETDPAAPCPAPRSAHRSYGGSTSTLSSSGRQGSPFGMREHPDEAVCVLEGEENHDGEAQAR